jgi:hypothetical protein
VEFTVIKGQAAIAAIKIAFIRQQASLTHQRNQHLPTGQRIDKGTPLELKIVNNIIIRPILFS